MRQLRPVVWMKGTFLSPQHLQTQDRFFEDSLQFRLESLAAHPRGFLRLQIDQEALDGGNFALTDAAGIFPDGLVFDCPASEPLPPPRPLAGCFDADDASIEVFLAIPSYRVPGLNVSAGSDTADTRFLGEAVLVRDENTGLTEKPIQVARKNFRILTTADSRQDCSLLSIARIRKSESGALQLDPQFVPQTLDFSSSPYLTSIARRLVEILAAKSSVLAGTRRQKNLSLADFGASDIANFWLLYTVNSHFPQLQQLFEGGSGHPERLFRIMLSLAGSLTTFSAKIHPRDLPAYDHDNLSGCFTRLDEILRTLLETVIPTNVVSLPLKLVQPYIYATALDHDKYLQNTRMYLAISAQVSEADLIAKVPWLTKVCSASHIEHLVRQALQGVQLTHVPKPPGAIPVKLNYQYFSLNQSGHSWEAICRARNFAVYVPDDLPSPQLELVILLPEAV